MGQRRGLGAVTSKCCHHIVNKQQWVRKGLHRRLCKQLSAQTGVQLYTEGYPGPKFATSSLFKRMNIGSQIIRAFKGSLPVFEVVQGFSQIWALSAWSSAVSRPSAPKDAPTSFLSIVERSSWFLFSAERSCSFCSLLYVSFGRNVPAAVTGL